MLHFKLTPMKTKRFIIILIVFSTIGIGLFLVVSGFGKQKFASLMVQSNSTSNVFVDGKKVGQTPYIGTFEAKEIILDVGNYQTRVSLEPGIKTVVERDFDSSTPDSSGEIISFEKIGGNATSLAVVTTPDLVSVTLDGVSRGKSPLKIDGLTSGVHNLSVTEIGYVERNFSINLVPGYKLTAVIDLASIALVKKPVIQINPNQIFVQILETPNGFLRVRSAPTVASIETGEVHPGEKYQLIRVDDKTGWYDIQLTATSSGWISNTYATYGLK